MENRVQPLGPSIAQLLAFATMLAAGSVWGHGEAGRAKTEARPISTEETAFGRQGNPSKATRTVRISMADTMRYTPSELKVKKGATIQFVVRNNGKLMHEMVIGTMADLKQHAELMKKHPGMVHEEPHMAHVAPGRSETLVWQFTKPGTFHFGCLEPGHFEAGMIGKVEVIE
jgi:uncharacterized cupredoxin-like copper-binding protein